MSKSAWLSLVVLASSAAGTACATSADPSVGGFTSSDSGARHDTTTSDGSLSLDTNAPGDDTAVPGEDSSAPTDDTGSAPKDSGSTKIDSGSTSTDTGSVLVDSGSTGVDTKPPPTDTAPPPTDTGTTGEGTTGNTCTSDLTCDLSGSGVNSCSNALFSLGPIYPTPVCIGVNPPECAADDGLSIFYCDGTRGVCLASGVDEICLPACTFDDTGAASVGCAGKDACNVYGWGRTSSGALTGIGYCFGGCKADADCPSSSKCQIETGLCVTTKVTYTKAPGTACTKAADAGTVPTCNCLYATATSKGYCANFCTVGGATCGTGYKCSPSLPTSDSTGALWTKDPTGVAGYCLKTCTADADCTAINAKCKDTATGKVCEPG